LTEIVIYPNAMKSTTYMGNMGTKSDSENAKKQDENSELVLEGTLTKQPCNFGKVGQPNKWVSFYALLAEKYHVQ